MSVLDDVAGIGHRIDYARSILRILDAAIHEGVFDTGTHGAPDIDDVRFALCVIGEYLEPASALALEDRERKAEQPVAEIKPVAATPARKVKS